MIDGLWLFAPNRETQGGSSWLLAGDAAEGHPELLVDCPALTEANLAFLQAREPGWIVLTSREGHGRVRRLQEATGWRVVVQEQEAYLLPGLQQLETFAHAHALAAGLELLWTPGPTPGSCVVAVRRPGIDGLFCGRLLLAVGPGALAPLHTARTFHGPRLQRSVAALLSWLPSGSPAWIATGGGLGALRGSQLVQNGAQMLKSLAETGVSSIS